MMMNVFNRRKKKYIKRFIISLFFATTQKVKSSKRSISPSLTVREH